MNWVLLIEDIMWKSCRVVDYKFPYVVLTLRFIDHFNIDVSNEIIGFTKASNEIIERHLKKLGMTYMLIMSGSWQESNQQQKTLIRWMKKKLSKS